MQRVTIFHSDRYDLVSYGNGLCYAAHDNQAKVSFFVQGDDANDFRAEMEAWPDDIATANFLAEQFAIRGE
jgi:hypothetical protein